MKEPALMADVSLMVVDAFVELNQAIMSLKKLKERTAQRPMDVNMRKERMMASAVLLMVQLNVVEARKAIGALMMKSLAKKTITREKRSTVKHNMIMMAIAVLVMVKNKEKTSLDVQVRGVLLVVQLTKNVMENVEAGMAGALMMKNLAKMSGTL